MMLNMIRVGENYINCIDEQILGLMSCVLEQHLIPCWTAQGSIERETQDVYFVRKGAEAAKQVVKL